MDHALDAGAVETAGGQAGSGTLPSPYSRRRREPRDSSICPNSRGGPPPGCLRCRAGSGPRRRRCDQAGASRYDIHGQLLQNLLPRDEPGARIALSARVQDRILAALQRPGQPGQIDRKKKALLIAVVIGIPLPLETRGNLPAVEVADHLQRVDIDIPLLDIVGHRVRREGPAVRRDRQPDAKSELLPCAR